MPVDRKQRAAARFLTINVECRIALSQWRDGEGVSLVIVLENWQVKWIERHQMPIERHRMPAVPMSISMNGGVLALAASCCCANSAFCREATFFPSSSCIGTTALLMSVARACSGADIVGARPGFFLFWQVSLSYLTNLSAGRAAAMSSTTRSVAASTLERVSTRSSGTGSEALACTPCAVMPAKTVANPSGVSLLHPRRSSSDRWVVLTSSFCNAVSLNRCRPPKSRWVSVAGGGALHAENAAAAVDLLPLSVGFHLLCRHHTELFDACIGDTWARAQLERGEAQAAAE